MRRLLSATLSAVALSAAGLAALAAAPAPIPGPPAQVSQKERAFQPNAVELGRFQALRIVNDDGELIHHAYVDSADFKFDSGEQEPGAHVDIRFPTAGSYTVRCGIHPKMRLAVTVR